MFSLLLFLAVIANHTRIHAISSDAENSILLEVTDLQDRSPYCLSFFCRYPNRCCPGYVCRFNLFTPFFVGLCVRQVNFYNLLGVGSKPLYDDAKNSTTAQPHSISTTPATTPGTSKPVPAPVPNNSSTTTGAPSASSAPTSTPNSLTSTTFSTTAGNSGNPTTARPQTNSTAAPVPGTINNRTATVAPSTSTSTLLTSTTTGPLHDTIPPPFFSFSFTARSRRPKARHIQSSTLNHANLLMPQREN